MRPSTVFLDMRNRNVWVKKKQAAKTGSLYTQSSRCALTGRRCKSLPTSTAHEMYWKLFLARLAAYAVGFAACFRPINMYLMTMLLGSGIAYGPA